VTENEEINLEKRLADIEKHADDDRKAISQLRKELEEAKIEFEDFRAASQTDMNLLMWLTDMVRAASLSAMEGRRDEAALCYTKARLQVEDLKNRLRP
jgi:hypothetical protein